MKKQSAFQTHKESVRNAFAVAFQRAFVTMGDRAKEIDWFPSAQKVAAKKAA